jgi:hypothetical protein
MLALYLRPLPPTDWRFIAAYLVGRSTHLRGCPYASTYLTTQPRTCNCGLHFSFYRYFVS